MMMVFMTQESVLRDNEYKSFKLLTRLNAKYEKKSIYSSMVFHCMKLKVQKDLKENGKINEKQFQLAYNREKQNIYDLIFKIKSYERLFATFELSTQDHLFEISNRIDLDFKDLEKDILNLKGN